MMKKDKQGRIIIFNLDVEFILNLLFVYYVIIYLVTPESTEEKSNNI